MPPVEPIKDVKDLNINNVVEDYTWLHGYYYAIAIDEAISRKTRLEGGDVVQNPADTFLYTGLVLWGKGQFKDAIRDYSKSIQLGGRNPIVYFMRSIALDQLGQYEQAMQDYGTVINNISHDADSYKSLLAQTHYNRGNLHMIDGEYNRAIQDFNKGIKLFPDQPKFYKERGAAYYNLGDYRRAVRNYDKAVQYDPQDAVVYHDRGEVYEKLAGQDYAKAEQIGYDGPSKYPLI